MLCRIFNQITKCIKKIFNRPKIKDSKRGSVISKTEFGRKSFPFWKKKSVQILTTTHQRGCFSRRKTHNSEIFFCEYVKHAQQLKQKSKWRECKISATKLFQ